MERRKFWFSLFVFSLGLAGSLTTSDFQDTLYFVKYIYHEEHRLFLTIIDDTNSCYFTHVDDTTKKAFDNCHHRFLEQEVYDKITSQEVGVLFPSSLDIMRQQFRDVFADFRCSGKKIYELRITFGDNYIEQCTRK